MREVLPSCDLGLALGVTENEPLSASATFARLRTFGGRSPTRPASTLGNIQVWRLQMCLTWGPVPATQTLAPTGRAGRGRGCLDRLQSPQASLEAELCPLPARET